MTGIGGDELLGSVVSAADVAVRLAKLEERFGAFPVREADRENAPEYFAAGVDRALSGWRGDAGALVGDVDGRVLLIRHADAPDAWGTPGGGHEPGESFATTARREVREETGVNPSLTGVREAIRTEVAHEGDAARTFTMLTVHFDAVVNDAAPAIDVRDDEILEARWFESPPESLHDHCREWVHDALAHTEDVDASVTEDVDASVPDGERASGLDDAASESEADIPDAERGDEDA